MLQATVQTAMLFKGVQRTAGELLTSDDLEGVSRTVLDALVSQKMLVLSEEGVSVTSNDGERMQHMQAQIDALKAAMVEAVKAAVAPLQARVDQLCADLGVESADAPKSGARSARKPKD